MDIQKISKTSLIFSILFSGISLLLCFFGMHIVLDFIPFDTASSYLKTAIPTNNIYPIIVLMLCLTFLLTLLGYSMLRLLSSLFNTITIFIKQNETTKKDKPQSEKG